MEIFVSLDTYFSGNPEEPCDLRQEHLICVASIYSKRKTFTLGIFYNYKSEKEIRMPD
jgi:hypothetical protein